MIAYGIPVLSKRAESVKQHRALRARVDRYVRKQYWTTYGIDPHASAEDTVKDHVSERLTGKDFTGQDAFREERLSDGTLALAPSWWNARREAQAEQVNAVTLSQPKGTAVVELVPHPDGTLDSFGKPVMVSKQALKKFPTLGIRENLSTHQRMKPQAKKVKAQKKRARASAARALLREQKESAAPTPPATEAASAEESDALPIEYEDGATPEGSEPDVAPQSIEVSAPSQQPHQAPPETELVSDDEPPAPEDTYAF